MLTDLCLLRDELTAAPAAVFPSAQANPANWRRFDYLARGNPRQRSAHALLSSGVWDTLGRLCQDLALVADCQAFLAAFPPGRVTLVLELTEPGSQARHLLTVGVTPGQITTLHSTPVKSQVGAPVESPAYAAVAASAAAAHKP